MKMKARLIISAIIAAISLLTFPLLKHIAYLERGYDGVIGGEHVAVVFGAVVVPLLIISHGLEKRRDEAQRDTENGEVNE
jgi:uncharacterized membrane protein